MDLLHHIRDREEVLLLADACEEQAQLLSKTIFNLAAPEPGPYAIFAHIAQLHKRIKQLKIIIGRLYDGRFHLLKTSVIQDIYRPKHWPPGVPYPREFTEISREHCSLDENLELDFETFLLFADTTLDELSKITAYALGLSAPDKFTLSGLSKLLRNDEMPDKLLENAHHMIWLDNYLRTYRNKFIVHRERPWQISHTSSVYGLNWQFFSPIPPGWLSEADIRKFHIELETLAGAQGIDPAASSQGLASTLLDNVRLPVDWVARDKTLKIAAIIGFETPSFHKFARIALEFLQGMFKGLLGCATAEPTKIKLGVPAWKEQSQSAGQQ